MKVRPLIKDYQFDSINTYETAGLQWQKTLIMWHKDRQIMSTDCGEQ